MNNSIVEYKTDPSKFIESIKKGTGINLTNYQSEAYKMLMNSTYGKQHVIMHSRQMGKSMLTSQLIQQQMMSRIHRVSNIYERTFKVKFIGKHRFILNKETGKCKIICLNIVKRKKNLMAAGVKNILAFLRNNHIGKGVKLEIERELMNVMT